MTDELDNTIGSAESSKLTAGSVIVSMVSIKPTKKSKVVAFSCKHPDSQELITLSAAKFKQVKGNSETILRADLWYNLDKENKIAKNSKVAELMRFYGKSTLKHFEGSILQTELDSNGYLCIKAY